MEGQDIHTNSTKQPLGWASFYVQYFLAVILYELYDQRSVLAVLLKEGLTVKLIHSYTFSTQGLFSEYLKRSNISAISF